MLSKHCPNSESPSFKHLAIQTYVYVYSSQTHIANTVELVSRSKIFSSMPSPIYTHAPLSIQFYISIFSQIDSAMAIKVYGFKLSTATLRVMACLAEKDLDFELVPVDLAAGDHKQPHFLSRNPFGQVPAFEDGDLKLFESRAITKYIAQAYADKGTDLIIGDRKKAAIQSVWMEVESQKFEPATSKLAWELCFKPMSGKTADEAVVEENSKALEQVLDVYEARLSESKYLGGDTFTLADLHHLPNMKYLMGTKVKGLFDARPHVGAWAAEIQSRPAWLKVISMP